MKMFTTKVGVPTFVAAIITAVFALAHSVSSLMAAVGRSYLDLRDAGVAHEQASSAAFLGGMKSGILMVLGSSIPEALLVLIVIGLLSKSTTSKFKRLLRILYPIIACFGIVFLSLGTPAFPFPSSLGPSFVIYLVMSGILWGIIGVGVLIRGKQKMDLGAAGESAASLPAPLDDPIYRQVGDELARKEYQPGPRARAVAEASGNQALADGLYVKMRVAQIKEELAEKSAREREARTAAEQEQKHLRMEEDSKIQEQRAKETARREEEGAAARIAEKKADITFNCPECGRSLEVDAAGAGGFADCPECSRPIRIPMRR